MEVKRLLCVDLGTFYCGIELSDVAEILRECQLTPIPCVPDYYMGVCNWKGSILAVASLQRVIGDPDMAVNTAANKDADTAATPENHNLSDISGRSVVIILKSKKYECGLLTEQKPQILEFHDENILSGDIPNVCGDLLKVREGYLSEDGRSVYVLDAESSLENLVVY